MKSDRTTKVLWLSHVLPWPPKGGLQQRAYYLMRAVGRRCDLRVISFSQKAHQRNAESVTSAAAELSKFATILNILPLPQDQHRFGQIRLAARSLIPGHPFTVRWGLSAAFGAATRKAIGEFRPDVVHFDTLSLAEYLDDIKDTPAVLNHHNIESQMLLRRSSLQENVLRRWYFQQEGRRLAAYERSVAKRFARHIVCSDLDAERLRSATGVDAIEVVPNGVDLSYFRPATPGLETEPNSLVFVGGLSWYPNADAIRFFLREVWPLIAARIGNVRIRIVGRDPPADIIEMARRDARIELLGFVDDIRPTVHSSAVFICPIRDGGGTKLKMLDAMAMGKAIVAHPVACEGLNVSHGREVMIAANPEQFSQHVAAVLSSATLRASLGAAARRLVETKYSFDSIGEGLSKTLNAAGRRKSDYRDDELRT